MTTAEPAGLRCYSHTDFVQPNCTNVTCTNSIVPVSTTPQMGKPGGSFLSLVHPLQCAPLATLKGNQAEERFGGFTPLREFQLCSLWGTVEEQKTSKNRAEHLRFIASHLTAMHRDTKDGKGEEHKHGAKREKKGLTDSLSLYILRVRTSATC